MEKLKFVVLIILCAVIFTFAFIFPYFMILKNIRKILGLIEKEKQSTGGTDSIETVESSRILEKLICSEYPIWKLWTPFIILSICGTIIIVFAFLYLILSK